MLLKVHAKRWRWLSLLAALVVMTVSSTPVKAGQAELITVLQAIQAKKARWKAGENLVSRLAPETRRRRLGLVKPEVPRTEGLWDRLLSAPVVNGTAPAGTFSWKNFTSSSAHPSLPAGNYVTGIRDQGNCGSCWAFGTTAALESSALITDGTPGLNLDLSEQVLVSCANSGNCSGGYITTASNYIRDMGLPAESCYPYLAQNAACTPKCSDYQVNTRTISGWYYVGNTTAPSLDAIKDALVTYGPLVTTMNVYTDFFYYNGGVYSYTSGTNQGGHAIAIVGYDDTNGCFIVKNSWGNWGESGFFRIAYSQMNNAVAFGRYTIYYVGETAPPPTPGAPVANFVANPSSGPAPLAVHFSDSSTGSPTAWSWNFGDGATSTAQNPAHTYANQGAYQVTLTASSAAGASSTHQTINVLAPPPAAPIASFSASPTSGQVPLTVHFTDSSTGSPTAWSWNFGDGVFSSSRNPSHIYNAAGTYNVTLTASNAGGSSSTIKTITATAPAQNCTYKISPTTKSFSLSGGSSSVQVTAGSNCSWTAKSNASWIHLDSGASGLGNGTVSYSVDAATSTRSGTMTIAGKTLKVYQMKLRLF
jgi:PKD repeat protein